MYIRISHLIQRFGEPELIQLTDEHRTGAIDEATVTAAIADAQSEIDSYLATKYSLPLSSEQVPNSLIRVTCDLARYYLYNDQAPETIRTRRNEAVDYLKGIAAGKVDLGITSGDEPAVNSGGLSQVKSGNSGFDWDAY